MKNRMNTKITISYLLILLIFSTNVFAQQQKNTPYLEDRPNVIVIFTDDLGYADLGVYGSSTPTPHLDQMAAEGVKFERFYVSNAVCSASRASLLTGAYSNRIGIYWAFDHNSKEGLNSTEESLPKILKQQDYATSIIGKWHLGHHREFLPLRHGFDEFYGIPYSHDMWPLHPENPTYYPPLPLYKDDEVLGTMEDLSHLTNDFTQKALDFIDRQKDQPFFLYLAHPLPHVPLFVSSQFKEVTGQGLYADVIHEIDWSVGQILKKLKDSGIDERTLVIFTSDNGPWLSYGHHSGSAFPLREGKGTSWEGGVRVPAIMRWPNKIPAGAVQHQPLMTIDLLPTIAGLVGAELPKQIIDGKNVWPLISMEENAVSPQEVYYFYYNKNELQAVMMGNWKLYLPHSYRTVPSDQPKRNDGTPVGYQMIKLEKAELYNLESDISEKINVLEKYPDVAKQLFRFADIAREDMGDELTGQSGKNRRSAGRIFN